MVLRLGEPKMPSTETKREAMLPFQRHHQKTGAGDESRTRDLNLGKVALYQLSYSRGQPMTITRRHGVVKFESAPEPVTLRLLGCLQVRPGAPQVIHHGPYGKDGSEVNEPGSDDSSVQEPKQHAMKQEHGNGDQLGDGLEFSD
jgi:hypothetical protein